MELKIRIVVVLFLVLIASTGCASTRPTLVHLEDADYHEMNEGDSYTTDRHGFFLSDYSLEEIVKVRVGK